MGWGQEPDFGWKCVSASKLVIPQDSVQDITGALFKHCEDSRPSSGFIPREKVVNLIKTFWGLVGAKPLPLHPSVSAVHPQHFPASKSIK